MDRRFPQIQQIPAVVGVITNNKFGYQSTILVVGDNTNNGMGLSSCMFFIYEIASSLLPLNRRFAQIGSQIQQITQIINPDYLFPRSVAHRPEEWPGLWVCRVKEADQKVVGAPPTTEPIRHNLSEPGFVRLSD